MRRLHTALIYVALILSSVALALSLRGAERAPNEAGAPSAHECADREARSGLAEIRRFIGERTLEASRLPPAPPIRTVPDPADGPSHAAPPPPDPGPRRYERIETANPAVTVTQKDDGTYDIRTSDPSLAGTIVEGTAFTESGEAERFLFRIPSPDQAYDAAPR